VLKFVNAYVGINDSDMFRNLGICGEKLVGNGNKRHEIHTILTNELLTVGVVQNRYFRAEFRLSYASLNLGFGYQLLKKIRDNRQQAHVGLINFVIFSNAADCVS